MYRKPTPEAQDLKTALEKLGLRVLAEVGDSHKHVDLSIPDARINIEVDGGQHLTDPYQILSDLKRTHYSDDLGYDTIHIPNQAVHTNLGGIASALAEAAALRIESRMGKCPRCKHALHVEHKKTELAMQVDIDNPTIVGLCKVKGCGCVMGEK